MELNEEKAENGWQKVAEAKREDVAINVTDDEFASEWKGQQGDGRKDGKETTRKSSSLSLQRKGGIVK